MTSLHRSTNWTCLVPSYSVKTSHHFDRDVEKIHAFLVQANCHPDSITAIFEQLYIDMKRLRTSPKMGAELSRKTSIPNDYRYLISGKYILFYKVFDKDRLVQIYHVYHSNESYLTKLGLSD